MQDGDAGPGLPERQVHGDGSGGGEGSVAVGGYRGGLIVYVNGKEAKREHIEAGKSLAEGPPCVDRDLTGLAIPSNLLRKGVNVIGLEVVRTPYAEATPDHVYEENSCQILSARLVAANSAGVVPSAVRPQGLQVWNTDAMATDVSADFGNPAEPLQPVAIIGAKNGRFTGKVVVGSTSAIRGLKVTPGELKGKVGSIPGTNVTVRYGVPWGEYSTVNTGNRKIPAPYALKTTRLGALAEKPLAVFDVLKPPSAYAPALRKDAAEGKSVDAAVVPLWLTVRVPATAGGRTIRGNGKRGGGGGESGNRSHGTARGRLDDARHAGAAHVCGPDAVPRHVGPGVWAFLCGARSIGR